MRSVGVGQQGVDLYEHLKRSAKTKIYLQSTNSIEVAFGTALSSLYNRLMASWSKMELCWANFPMLKSMEICSLQLVCE